MPITREDLMKVQRRAQAAITRAKSLKEQTDKAVGHVVQSLEVSSMAFGFGVVNGRWQGAELLGMPADLAAGVALHTLGFLSDTEENARHLHNFADGATASFFNTLGVGVGKRWREEHTQQLPSPTSPPPSP